ncbi:hypothetical protein [Halobaculum sp. EA56]|uniref:hypothetical protein n=1 Tax=Halobaculum sp. EA56 TaxID=3421648 RepID=UPI003EC07DF3
MDLDELRSVQSKERRKDSLQHLRDSFYEDVAAYLAERKRQRDERAAAVDNPFADEQVRKLSDEIETAEEVVESLYERRVGKVVKLSSFAAAGAPTDTEGMTVQEAELFEDLVVRIEQNKGRVLDVLDNDAEGADGDVDVGFDAAQEEVPAVASGSGPPGSDQTGDTADRVDGTPGAPADALPSDGSIGADDPGDPSSDGDAGSGVLADAMGTTGSPSDTDAGSGSDGPVAPPESPPDAGASDPGSDGDSARAAAAEDGGEFVPGSEPDRAGEAPADTDPGAADAPAEGGRATGDARDDGADRRTVRITSDVGRILGVDDIEYDLASDDVVTLPATNAEPLVERDAAEPIE